MSVKACIHGLKAVGHACAGDLVGAAEEGGKAIFSLALGEVVKEVADSTGISDWIEDIFS